jgi:2-oxoglutarate ferredoxin oxidoreductase subunit beta
MRRNIDITYIVMDNEIYGCHRSGVARKGEWTKSTPGGCPEDELNPLAMALVAGATYVARGSSAEQEHLTNLIAQGIQHKGFALIDVFSPCVTYNKHNTHQWFKERVYKLEETDYEPTDYERALVKVREWGDQIPIGLGIRRAGRRMRTANRPSRKATRTPKLGLTPNSAGPCCRVYVGGADRKFKRFCTGYLCGGSS